jgi:3-hydroxyisobutyrate dehydrogenase
MAVGYLGLGNMGGALAERLQLSTPLHVYDHSTEAVGRLAAAGASPVHDARELAAACEVIILCLPTSDHVRSALFDDGFLDSVRPGTLIIDQTTGDPTVTRAIAAELASRQITFVDAPVSGGTKGAQAGTISIMVGASECDFERAQAVLSAISPNIYHAGGVGAGHAMKLVNNLISGTQRLLTLEGLALAAKNGIEPAKAVEILKSGGARNSYMENVVEPYILQGNLSLNFTLGLAHKDVRLGCQLAIDSDVPMFFGSVTRELLQVCINEMGREAQVDTAALVIDRLCGTSVVPADYTAE